MIEVLLVRALRFASIIVVGTVAAIGAEVRTPKWTYTTGAPVLSSPALSAGGVLYVGSYDEKLHAVNAADGSFHWSFSVKPTRINQAAYIYSSPAIGADGTIYVGTEERNFLSPASSGGTLYAINPNGSEKWKYPVPAAIYSDPAIAADGTIYFGCYDTNLYALNPNGTLKWKYPAGGTIFSDPVVGSDGTIYFGCDDGHLYAVNPNGSFKWKFATGGVVTVSPSIGADGTIYAGATTMKLFAINPDGSEKWQFLTGGGIHSSAAIAGDGTIYFGSNDGNLYAINSAGEEKWRFPAGSPVKSSPALAADGMIYVGDNNGNFIAVNSSGELVWTFTSADYILGSPVIGPDGTVFVSSADNSLYALSGSAPLANSPWPMFRHDPLHTARMPASGNVPVNQAPTLSMIADATLDEGTILTFTAQGSDADVPAQTLTYSLTGAPPGANINPTTGLFSWTPTEAQGPGSFDITVVVTDNGSPNLSASRTFKATVQEVNQTPTLGVISNQSVDEGAAVTFTAQGSDADVPAQVLTYALSGAPQGATINPTTGLFSWTPTEAQGPGTFNITVVVSDNGSPNLSASRTVEIVVREVNSAPMLALIPNQTVAAGGSVTFTASATDADLPSNQLSYFLIAGPAGASIDAGTGAFSWTTSLAQAGTHTVTVEVRDNGSPALTSRQSFDVMVEAPGSVQIESIHHANGTITITWKATIGKTYRVLYSSELGAGATWSSLSGDVQATGETASKQDQATQAPRFYKVMLVD